MWTTFMSILSFLGLSVLSKSCIQNIWTDIMQFVMGVKEEGHMTMMTISHFRFVEYYGIAS